MQQEISIITLAIEDISKLKQFYINGFGWQPIYQTNDTLFYQKKCLKYYLPYKIILSLNYN